MPGWQSRRNAKSPEVAPDHEARAWTDPRQQAPQLGKGKGDAALRRAEAWTRGMDEDRTSASAQRAGFTVPVDINDEIVKPVVTPHSLVPGTRGKAYQVVVPRIGGIVAPAVRGTRGARGQAGARARRAAIGAEEQPDEREITDRGGTIALALAPGHPAFADGTGEHPPPGNEPAARSVTRSGQDADCCQKSPFHAISLWLTRIAPRAGLAGSPARVTLRLSVFPGESVSRGRGAPAYSRG